MGSEYIEFGVPKVNFERWAYRTPNFLFHDLNFRTVFKRLEAFDNQTVVLF